jgi:hypothetical protein
MTARAHARVRVTGGNLGELTVGGKPFASRHGGEVTAVYDCARGAVASRRLR